MTSDAGYTCPIFDSNTACSAAGTMAPADLASYLSCLSATDLCALDGFKFRCDAQQLFYTYLRDPAKCQQVSKAQECRPAASIAACAAPLQELLEAYQCSPSGPQLTAGAVTVLFVVLAVAVVVVPRMAKAARPLLDPDYQPTGCLQSVDATLARWKNHCHRNWLLNTRRPWAFFFEQATPMFLSLFLLVMVNLKPSTQLDVKYPIGGIYSVEIDFGKAALSSLSKQFLEHMESFFALFFILAYAQFVSSLTASLVREKESRATELLQVMGSSLSEIHGAWFLGGLLTSLPLSILMGTTLSLGGVFRNEEPSAMSLFFWAFSGTILAFSHMAATCFDRAKTASWVAPLAWLLLHFLSYRAANDSTGVQTLYGLLPQVGFGLGVDRFSRESLYPAALASLCSESTLISVSASTCLMVIESGLMLVTGWYLAQVLPREHGAEPLPWHFCFHSDYWTSSGGAAESKGGEELDSSLLEQAALDFPAPVEPFDAHRSQCIEVRGLRKTWSTPTGQVAALDGLDIRFQKGEISVLLGPNGAGKTTTIGVLTGMVAPDQGSVDYFSRCSLGEMREARRSMGLCPQHDVLFEELTARESLAFYVAAKGVRPDGIAAEVDALLMEVGLTAKADCAVESLSGGQRRKLSLAIALCGGSETIILDEPTAGMDPVSRREIWELIRRHRAGRVVLLTTHFLDEADAIGDRISIVAQGKLCCQGSSIFLQNAYPQSYTIQAAMAAGLPYDAASFLALAQGFIPEARLSHTSSDSSQLQLKVPDVGGGALLVSLLQALETKAQEGTISELTLTAPGLEDVFFSVVGEQEPPAVPEKKGRIEAQGAGFWRQFWALLQKRFLYGTRDFQSALLGTCMPLMFLVSLSVFPPFDFVAMGIVTELTPQYQKLQVATNAFLGSLVVSIAMLFLPVSVVTYVVKEAEPLRDVHQLQLVCGVKPLAYWTSLFVHDAMVALPAVVVSGVVLSGFFARCGASLDSEQHTAMAALLAAYGFGQIPFTYAISRRFDDHSKAQTSLLTWGLLSGPLLSIVGFVLKFISSFPSGTSLAMMNQYVEWVYIIFPGFALADGLHQVAMRDFGTPIGYYGDGFNKHAEGVSPAPYCPVTGSRGPWGQTNDPSCWAAGLPAGTSSCCTPSVLAPLNAGRDLAYMVVLALIGVVVLSFRQSKKDDGGATSTQQPEEASDRSRMGYATLPHRDDDDVVAEEARVQGLAVPDGLVVKGLRKKYGNGKVALQGLSIGVGKGCFGYIGENGAGKSTTIKILTGAALPTSGEALVSGHNVVSDRANARRSLGFCPQHHALLENLTVREHLNFFSEVKGIPAGSCEQEVSRLISMMRLESFEDTLAQALSGGNKRKLQTAIALLGSPDVVILDEPSTGMDPVSRRFMWQTVSHLAKADCTVMLVSHLMEECEALCDRVGVLVDGRLCCVGSPQHLKTKFGQGECCLDLMAPSDDATVSRIQGHLQASFERVTLIASGGGQIRFGIHTKQPLSSVVSTVLETKLQHGIVAYSVGQANLERVFQKLVAAKR